MLSYSEYESVQDAYRLLPERTTTMVSLEKFTRDVAERQRLRHEPAMSLLVGKLNRGDALTDEDRIQISKNKSPQVFTKDRYPRWVAIAVSGNPIRDPMSCPPHAHAILCWWSQRDAEATLAAAKLTAQEYTLRELSPEEFAAMQGWWGWIGIAEAVNGEIKTGYYCQQQIIFDFHSPDVSDIVTEADDNAAHPDLSTSIRSAVSGASKLFASGPAIYLKERADLLSVRYDTDESWAIEWDGTANKWRVVIQGICSGQSAGAPATSLAEAKATVEGLWVLNNIIRAMQT